MTKLRKKTKQKTKRKNKTKQNKTKLVTWCGIIKKSQMKEQCFLKCVQLN